VTQKSSSHFNDEDACALKLVSKEVFWKRVNLGKERTDSLVREVLAQSLACDGGDRSLASSTDASTSGNYLSLLTNISKSMLTHVHSQQNLFI